MRAIRCFSVAVVLCAFVGVLPGAARAGGSIALLKTVPFAQGTFVRPAVKAQCKMNEELPHWVQEYAKKEGVQVELVDALPKSGRVLELEIRDTIELGNAWNGRQKGLEIQGRLLEDGKVVGTFHGRRMTRGGMWGGYKGTCSFFGRCAKTLGHDVATWLENPGKNATIGG